jgi:hypothetical protein
LLRCAWARLARFLSELEVEFRQASAEGDKLAHEYRSAVARFEKARAAYSKLRREGTVEGATAAAETCQEAAAEASARQQAFVSGTRRLLEAVRDVSRRRAASAAQYVRKWVDICDEVPTEERARLARIADALAVMSAEADQKVLAVKIRAEKGPAP